MDNHAAALFNMIGIKPMPWQEVAADDSFRRPMVIPRVPRQQFHFFPSPNFAIKELTQ